MFFFSIFIIIPRWAKILRFLTVFKDYREWNFIPRKDYYPISFIVKKFILLLLLLLRRKICFKRDHRRSKFSRFSRSGSSPSSTVIPLNAFHVCISIKGHLVQLRGNDWGRFSFKWWQWNNNSDVTSPIRRNRYHPSIVVIVIRVSARARFRDPTWDSLSNLVTQFLPFLESLARYIRIGVLRDDASGSIVVVSLTAFDLYLRIRMRS